MSGNTPILNISQALTFTSGATANFTGVTVSGLSLALEGYAATGSPTFTTYVGFSAGTGNTGTNVFAGAQNSAVNNTGNGVVAIGLNALGAGNTANFAIAIGDSASQNNTSGSGNIAIGYEALQLNTTASECTVVGYQAGASLPAASTSVLTAFGYQALTASTVGGTAFGAGALAANTTGTSNNAFGFNCAMSNVSASGISAHGSSAAKLTTVQTDAFGASTLTANTTGTGNSGFGFNALMTNTTASNSAAFGYQSFTLSTGAGNSGHGYQTGVAITTGANNAFFGSSAGNAPQTCSNCTCLGQGTNVSNALTFSTAVGSGATGLVSSQVQLGRAATDNVNVGNQLLINTVQLTDNAGRIVSGVPAATFTAGVGAGTGPTISVTGSGLGGTISVLTGSAPTASAAVVTVTFSSAYLTAPSVIICPANSAAALLTGTAAVYLISTSTTNFVLEVGSTALSATTTYLWNYHVIH
jgi:trimeric autotransporter adhesin